MICIMVNISAISSMECDVKFFRKYLDGNEIISVSEQIISIDDIQDEAVLEALRRREVMNVVGIEPMSVDRLQRHVETGKPSNKVFISYSRSDWSTFVAPLVDGLARRGISYWVDQHLIEGGDDWMDEINRALRECTHMILCVSPDALESKYVKLEYRNFFNNEKPLYPLLCRPVALPAELQVLQYFRYETAQLEQLFTKLRS
jgi:hypothetical protein